MEMHNIFGVCFSVLDPWSINEVEELKNLITIACKFFMDKKPICLVVKEPHKLSLGFDFGIPIYDKKNKHLCTYIESISLEQIVELTSENEEFIDSTMRFLIFDDEKNFKKDNFDQYLDVLYAPELGKYKSIFVNHDANSFYLYNFSKAAINEMLSIAGKDYLEKFETYL